MRLQTLVFDLDGTLSDPFEGISRSINYALAARGFDTVDAERIRPMIGPPLNEIFSHFLGELTESVMLGLVDSYRERYADIGYRENTMYDGIPDIMEALAAAGYRMGICTSKRADYAGRIVEMFGLDQHFEFVSGGDIGIEKRQQIEHLVAQGLAIDAAVMIGDRAVDIHAGKSNGLASAGVLWGFGAREELSAATPDYLLATPAELLDAFIPGENA